MLISTLILIAKKKLRLTNVSFVNMQGTRGIMPPPTCPDYEPRGGRKAKKRSAEESDEDVNENDSDAEVEWDEWGKQMRADKAAKAEGHGRAPKKKKKS